MTIYDEFSTNEIVSIAGKPKYWQFIGLNSGPVLHTKINRNLKNERENPSCTNRVIKTF